MKSVYTSESTKTFIRRKSWILHALRFEAKNSSMKAFASCDSPWWHYIIIISQPWRSSKRSRWLNEIVFRICSACSAARKWKFSRNDHRHFSLALKFKFLFTLNTHSVLLVCCRWYELSILIGLLRCVNIYIFRVLTDSLATYSSPLHVYWFKQRFEFRLEACFEFIDGCEFFSRGSSVNGIKLFLVQEGHKNGSQTWL